MKRKNLAARLVALASLVAAMVAGAFTAPSAWAAYPTSATTPYTLVHQYYDYWCGPAATEIALTTWGKPHTYDYQHTLAVAENTIANGETNSIADVSRVMNQQIGYVWYYNTYIPGSYATSAEKAALKSNILGDIASSRKAMVANVYTSATDVSGHVHSYPEGHYVALVGYRNSGDQVLIADPASGGSTYWMTTARLADWIGLRGYNW
jgi:hypothetical protein